MAKTLDFTTRKKEYLTVKLNDEKKTVLMIGTPTKELLDEFLSVTDDIGEDGEVSKEALDNLYRVCARIMSFNKGGVKITEKEISALFDLEDIMVFLNAYSEFLTTVTNAKN